MKIDMDNREGPLSIKLAIRTTPDCRVSSAAALELFDKLWRDVAVLVEPVAGESSLTAAQDVTP